MKLKQQTVIIVVALCFSFIVNVASFWQLSEAKTNHKRELIEQSDMSSKELYKLSKDEQAEREELAQTIKEQVQTIDKLKAGKALVENDPVNEEQIKLAEDFSKVVVDKSVKKDKMEEILSELATLEVINKLIPSDLEQMDKNQGSFSITLGDVSSYVQTSKGNEVTFVVFIDYKISNPQFKDVKPQTIKSGLTVTEIKQDNKWLVSDFSYFTR